MRKIKCRKYSDERLVDLTLKDEDYFLCLMKKYEEKLKRYIHRLTNVSREEAEDLLQEIFIKAYQNLNDFDKNLKFSSWMYRIAHNQIISHWRKIKRRPQKAEFNVNNGFLDNLASDLNMEKEINNRFLRKEIEQTLDKLNIKYREVLILRFFEEKSYEEISDIVKKPKGTVATLLNRAKKELKKHL